MVDIQHINLIDRRHHHQYLHHNLSTADVSNTNIQFYVGT